MNESGGGAALVRWSSTNGAACGAVNRALRVVPGLDLVEPVSLDVRVLRLAQVCATQVGPAGVLPTEVLATHVLAMALDIGIVQLLVLLDLLDLLLRIRHFPASFRISASCARTPDARRTLFLPCASLGKTERGAMLPA